MVLAISCCTRWHGCILRRRCGGSRIAELLRDVDLREFLNHGLPFHTVPRARVSPHPNIPEYIRQVLVLLVVLLALFKI